MDNAAATPYFDEADRIARYLIGKAPTARERELYAEAQEKLEIRLDARDAALLRAALANQFMAGIIDGGLALTEPRSLVRKKFFVMLAILEASPAHCDKFLSEGFGIGGIIQLGARSVAAGIRGVLGAIYLKLFRPRSSPAS